MAAAAWANESATVADLPPVVIYAGARAPETVRYEVLVRFESGEVVTKEIVEDLLDAYDKDRLTSMSLRERTQYEKRLARREAKEAIASSWSDMELPDQPGSLQAAREAFARLSERFERHEILELIDLLISGRLAAVRRMAQDVIV